jgi:hypothetical protein
VPSEPLDDLAAVRRGARDPHADRLVVSPGAVLSEAEAVRLLPVRDGDARAWLRQRGLIRYLAGRPVVVWSQVIAALDGDQRPEPRRATTTLPRVRL